MDSAAPNSIMCISNVVLELGTGSVINVDAISEGQLISISPFSGIASRSAFKFTISRVELFGFKKLFDLLESHHKHSIFGRTLCVFFSDDLPVQIQVPPCGQVNILSTQGDSLLDVTIIIDNTASLSSIEFSVISLSTGSAIVPDANDISFSDGVNSDVSSSAQIDVLESGILVLTTRHYIRYVPDR